MSDRRYPLSWPMGWPRARWRQSASFGTGTASGGKRPATVAEAIGRLQGELDRLGAQQVVLSTNVELRLDGMPRSDRSPPADTGVSGRRVAEAAGARPPRLQGMDLICWCPINSRWCHADTLLRLANEAGG